MRTTRRDPLHKLVMRCPAGLAGWIGRDQHKRKGTIYVLLGAAVLLNGVIADAHAGRTVLGSCSPPETATNAFYDSDPNRFAIDKVYYCYQAYKKYECPRPVVLKEHDAYSWRCEYKEDGLVWEAEMNLGEACLEQYGPFAKAKLLHREVTDGWYCELPEQMKLPYHRASYGLALKRYCEIKYDDPSFRAEYITFNGVTGWHCVNPVYEPGNHKLLIDLGDACTWQYGAGAQLLQQQGVNKRDSYYCSILSLETKQTASQGELKPKAPSGLPRTRQVYGNFDIPRHSFNFGNDWKSDFVVKLPIFGTVNLGRSRYGLCGGMIYAAHDSFWYESTSGRETTSPDRAGGYRDVPPQGNRLRDYIWNRQMDSLKRDNWYSVRKLGHWLQQQIPQVERMSRLEWERKIKPGIDKGWAIPLMIVISPSFTKNHQVLAIGYEWHAANNEWDIVLYDPNVPDQETLLHTGIKKIRPRNTNINYELAFRGYFVTKYRGQKPWWAPGASAGDWKPGARPGSDLRDPLDTGDKESDKPEALPARPTNVR